MVIQQISALRDEDRAKAWEFLQDYVLEVRNGQGEGWVKKSNGESQAMKALTMAFLETHEKYLSPIFPSLNDVMRRGKGEAKLASDEKQGD